MPYSAHHAAEKQREATQRYRQKLNKTDAVKAIFQNMLWDSRKRAKKRGMEHTLTIEDLYSLYTNTCPINGVDLLWERGHGKPQENSPSLDRIDSTKGYTKDNVWLISYRMNRIKNDATIEELQMILSACLEVTSNTSSKQSGLS
jgi:hypothetical protein